MSAEGSNGPSSKATDVLRGAARLLLAGFLGFAGVGHFVNSEAFQAQVPPWMPAPAAVIAISGVIEICLCLALITLSRWRVQVGWIVAAFFVAVFPGNISQFVTETPAFGLDTDMARFIRLLFQPLLVLWALWCTGAWKDRRSLFARS